MTHVILICLLATVAIAVSVLCGFLYLKIEQMQADKNELLTRDAQQKLRLKQLENSNDQLKAQVRKLLQESANSNLPGLLSDDGFIKQVCQSYHHQFNYMATQDQMAYMFKCREWIRSVLDNLPPPVI